MKKGAAYFAISILIYFYTTGTERKAEFPCEGATRHPILNRMISTPVTLLERLRNPNQAEAWSQFVRLYAPLILRFVELQGFRDADAEDAAQDVLLKLVRLMPTYQRLSRAQPRSHSAADGVAGSDRVTDAIFEKETCIRFRSCYDACDVPERPPRLRPACAPFPRSK